ncbi:protein PTHB1-like isoform X2 [Andrena cerasifolii]|uniref:protein PTHB1-like isoform X2 n=1 Tax=Andrena cerasifolii TaxID=2819439 RepID=UPI0040377F99
MSLFKTKEWWRTACGSNETFNGHSLLVTALFGEEKKDVLVVGSQDGYLRMYSPSSQWVEETKCPTNYKSTDSMIETRIGDCIVDMKTGKFVSGSQNLRLAILTSSKLLVYDLILANESTEYGDRCDLKLAYEHSLPRFPATLTTGPFGGVRGRDFLCVQCLDGTLLFYEQEVFAFSQVLKNRLLPQPIVYVSRNDLFVTASSSWFLECYRHESFLHSPRARCVQIETSPPRLDARCILRRYQSMAESARGEKPSTTKRADDDDDDDDDRANVAGVAGKGRASVEPDWSYNIGEAILDIQPVTLSSFEVGIVALGEKHLYCLKDNCSSVKYAKRLEYKPLCFRAYVIEPDGKLMVVVIADTSTLMIYEGTTLKWSAQLPFAPVTVGRAQLQLEGVIVVLSEDGRLEACYLGSEPGMFVAPPLHPRGYDYAAAEQQLAELRSQLNRGKDTEDRTSDATMDAELIVSVNVSPDLEASPRTADGVSDERTEERRYCACRVGIELSSYATLRDVQISVDVCKPLVVAPDFHALPNLCQRHLVETWVRVDGDLPAISSEMKVVVTYRTDTGNLRVLQRTGQLPLKMMLIGCSPENATTFTTILKRNEPLVGLTQLFPEFTGEQLQRQNWNALGMRPAHNGRNGRAVTIVSGNASNRYRVQSTDGLSTTLVVQQLMDRLKGRTTGSLTATIGQNHLQLVHSRIEAHFLARREIDRITTEIGLLTIQLRNIERKMLRAVRERNGRSLADTGLPFLIDSTYRATFVRLEDFANARTKQGRTGHELWCSLRLLLLLLRVNTSEEKYAAIEAAIGFEPRPCDQLNWEEIADAALVTLLRFVSKKPSLSETKPFSWNTVTPMTTSKELGKLKKRLVHAIERLDDTRGSDIAEIEAGDGQDLASV